MPAPPDPSPRRRLTGRPHALRPNQQSLAPLPRAVVRVLRDPLVFFPLVSLLQWWVLYPIGAARRLDWPVLAGAPGGPTSSFHNTENRRHLSARLEIAGTHDTRARLRCAGHALHVAAAACVGRGHLLGLFFGSIVGTGLFHLQHACNPCYRAQSLAYNPIAASLRGSTMLKARGAPSTRTSARIAIWNASLRGFPVALCARCAGPPAAAVGDAGYRVPPPAPSEHEDPWIRSAGVPRHSPECASRLGTSCHAWPADRSLSR